MNFDKLKKKSVKLIIENNIWNDIVRKDDHVETLFKTVDKKIESSPRNLLVVVLNRNNKIDSIITSKDFGVFIKILKKALKEPGKISDMKIKKLDLDKFNLKIGLNAVKETVKVGEALDVLRKKNLEVLVIVDKKNKYLGKIKRTSLRKRINELLD